MSGFSKAAIWLAIIAGIAITVAVVRSRPDPEAEALAAADLEQAELIRKQGAKSGGLAEPDYGRYERAEQNLKSSNPLIACNAANTLARSQSADFIPPLAELSRNSPHASVRDCAASALADLGAFREALNVYFRLSQSNDREDQHRAINGYGRLGPDAARDTLPYLEQALRSDWWGTRLVAVSALAQLGPAAEPLLEIAAEDEVREIREEAKPALARLKR